MKLDLILEKAIEKAVKNGFNGEYYRYDYNIEVDGTKGAYRFIFDHNFAKAFFGEFEVTEAGHYFDVGGSDKDKFLSYYQRKKVGEKQWFNAPRVQNWQYHLQKMVVAPDPIRYLEVFL